MKIDLEPGTVTVKHVDNVVSAIPAKLQHQATFSDLPVAVFVFTGLHGVHYKKPVRWVFF